MTPRVLHSAMKLIKRVPNPESLWQEHRLKALGLLTVVFLLQQIGRDSLLIWDLKTAISGIASTAVICIFYLLLWCVRHGLEKRPSPLERVVKIKRLVDSVLYDMQPGESARRLKFQRTKFSSRLIKSADTRDLTAIMTRMNCNLFEDSVHGQGFVEKMARNLSHAKKNPKVIRLLGMTDAGVKNLHSNGSQLEQMELGRFPAVGFSHVIPISKATYDIYVIREKGGPGIEDVNFPAEHVCAPCEKAYAFLVFTAAIDAARIRRWELGPPVNWGQAVKGGRSKLWHLLKAERELYLMLFEQLRELATLHLTGEQECLVLAQAFKGRAEKTLQQFGFKKIEGAHTADNEPLYQMKIRFA